jgi:hypothetical protein
VSFREETMKRKDRPNIPDFSKKLPSKGTVPQGSKVQQPTRVASPGPMAKPQATSSKSGRRGT